jgi:hypothetical protein
MSAWTTFRALSKNVFAAALWTLEPAKRAGVSTTLPPPRFLIGESFKGLQVLAAALDKERQAFYGVQFAGVITLSALLQVSPGMLPPNQSLR